MVNWSRGVLRDLLWASIPFARDAWNPKAFEKGARNQQKRSRGMLRTPTEGPEGPPLLLGGRATRGRYAITRPRNARPLYYGRATRGRYITIAIAIAIPITIAIEQHCALDELRFW